MLQNFWKQILEYCIACVAPKVWKPGIRENVPSQSRRLIPQFNLLWVQETTAELAVGLEPTLSVSAWKEAISVAAY